VAKRVRVLYPDPVTGDPPRYVRDSIPVIDSCPDGSSLPTPSTIDFTPGELLGCVSGALGLRKFFEDRDHELVVTSEKNGPDSEFERELPGSAPTMSISPRRRAGGVTVAVEGLDVGVIARPDRSGGAGTDGAVQCRRHRVSARIAAAV
jgi:hypothetical protein